MFGMPSPKSHRRGSHEKNKKGRLAEKTSSFHGRGSDAAAEMIPMPRTVPDLLSGRRSAAEAMVAPPKLTKLLLNVTIQRSPGAVHVVMPPEATVAELIAAALRQCAKEARRPVLPSADTSGFDLHCSQFSLESLDRDEKLMDLGSRNFFLCPKAGGASGGAWTSNCSREATSTKGLPPWVKFMELFAVKSG